MFAGRFSDGGSCVGIGVGVDVFMRLSVDDAPFRPLIVDAAAATGGLFAG